MGKLLPRPYPGQSMDEYREQLTNFRNNYWSSLKSPKGGSKFIPLPPKTLIKKTKEMTRKLSEHVEEEFFNKEKSIIPKVEVVIPEPVKTKNYFIHGFIVGMVITFILYKLYFDYN